MTCRARGLDHGPSQVAVGSLLPRNGTSRQVSALSGLGFICLLPAHRHPPSFQTVMKMGTQHLWRWRIKWALFTHHQLKGCGGKASGKQPRHLAPWNPEGRAGLSLNYGPWETGRQNREENHAPRKWGTEDGAPRGTWTRTPNKGPLSRLEPLPPSLSPGSWWLLRRAVPHLVLFLERSMKVNKRKLQLKLESGGPVEGTLTPHHSPSVTQNRKTSVIPTEKTSVTDTNRRDMPCAPQKAGQLLYPEGGRLPFLPSSKPIPSSAAPFSSAFNLSPNQGLFKWVSFSHQVAKVLEFQLQHQSFQWVFRTDLL